jgi:hypothetical protein
MLVVGTHLCANHTSVLTFHEIPRKLKYIEQWENTRKSWAQFTIGRCRAAYSRPAGISISQSSVIPSGNVSHAAQRTPCNGKLANWWKIRPPGLLLGRLVPLAAVTPRVFKERNCILSCIMIMFMPSSTLAFKHSYMYIHVHIFLIRSNAWNNDHFKIPING